MKNRSAEQDSKTKLKAYLSDLKIRSKTTKLPKISTVQMANDVGIPRSTLYKYHKSELSEFKRIINSSSSSSSKRLLQSARRENKTLRERNELLTSIAHEYFIENETLKAKITALKNRQIVRIK